MDNTLSLDYQQTDFGREFAEEVERLDGRIDDEIEARSNADDNLQSQIDTIKASSDVVDIVGTYAELEEYDTSKLNDNDIVKVLEDETHDGDITYYRWSTSTKAFSFVGSLSAYYSKGETDTLLSGKQDTLTAGTNIQINDNVISATGTTYTAGTGLNLSGTEFSVDTTVVATKSDLPAKTSDLTNDGADGTSTYVEVDDLATVATTGAYSDLSGTPTIPTATSDLTNNGSDGTSTYVEASDLATVATSGSYTDLTNTPTIPAAQVNSDWNATSGVAEILNKPTIPAAQVNSDWNASSGVAEILNKPTLAAVATSGAYSDLTGTPTIPTVNNATLTVTQNGTTAGTFTANSSSDTTIALTDTTYADFTGATSSVAGTHGLVPAPTTSDVDKYLKGDGTWGAVAGSGLVELSYGSSTWNDFITAYQANKIVYCRASSNTNPATGSQTRKAFMAYVNNADSPTEVEFQYVRSVSSKTDSQQSDQVFVYKLTNVSGGAWTVESRSMAPKIVAGAGMASTFTNGANATITLSASTMTGATSSTAGVAGIVPAPAAGDNTKFLAGNGTWATPDAPVITMSSVDPGEGGSLAADNYIFIYDAGA